MMPPTELARRLCVSNQVHDAKRKGPAPCAGCVVKANQWWGLASDPKMKADFDTIARFRQDQLGKHN
jgi:hypothetical protein